MFPPNTAQRGMLAHELACDRSSENLPKGAESMFGYSNGSLMPSSVAPASKAPARVTAIARKSFIVAVLMYYIQEATYYCMYATEPGLSVVDVGSLCRWLLPSGQERHVMLALKT